MSSPDLSRRTLLAGILSLAGAALTPLGAIGTERKVVAVVASWLGRDAAVIGERYLQSHVAEADLDVLTDLLLERLKGTVGDFPEQLWAAAQEDFRRDDVVLVDGWLLSRTEVRVCAVAYLAECGVVPVLT